MKKNVDSIKMLKCAVKVSQALNCLSTVSVYATVALAVCVACKSVKTLCK